MVASEQPPVGKIFQAIPAMIAECEHIAKSQRNQQQGFQYRGIDQVYSAVHPLLAKYKVFPTNEILDETRSERESKSGSMLFFTKLKIRYWFNADDGSRVPTEVIGEGMDSGDKASNKAMSIAYKYALFQLLCIPTMAVDPDAETHEVAAKPAEAPSREPKPTASDKSHHFDAAMGLIKAAKDEAELDHIADTIKAEIKAGKLTRAHGEQLGHWSRTRRESMKSMEQMNERFEESGV